MHSWCFDEYQRQYSIHGVQDGPVVAFENPVGKIGKIPATRRNVSMHDTLLVHPVHSMLDYDTAAQNISR